VGASRPLFRVSKPGVPADETGKLLDSIIRSAMLVPAKPRVGNKLNPRRYPVVVHWFYAETHDAPIPPRARKLYARPVSLTEGLRRVQKKWGGIQFGRGMVVQPRRQVVDHAARSGRRRAWYE